MKKKTSIIILTYNNLSLTIDCIESIRKYTDPNTYEIVVVDNNSQDETPNWLRSQDDLIVIFNQENVGFPKGCNIGIEAASKENDILLLNNDTIVTTNCLVIYKNVFIVILKLELLVQHLIMALIYKLVTSLMKILKKCRKKPKIIILVIQAGGKKKIV